MSSETRARLRLRARRLRRPAWLGTLRRFAPVSDRWGYDRGTPVDRYYIEQFLREQASDIRGRVLEVKSDAYARRFGSGVESVEVLDVDAGNPRATIVADLSRADAIASEAFDCFVLTQTLQFVADVRTAIEHAYRALRPGGVLLASVPAVSRIATGPFEPDYWRFTPLGCSTLFSAVCGEDAVEVRSYGNVVSAIAFLVGMAHEELSRRDLERNDPRYPVVVGVRVAKPRS